MLLIIMMAKWHMAVDDDDDDDEGSSTGIAGHTQEALREFIHLKDHPHLSLCSTAALIYTHKRCETIGNSELHSLNSMTDDWSIDSVIFCVFLHPHEM